MALETYRKKRDVKKTGEPLGKKGHTKSHNSFVIQKHAARRLHYDFRLELDGVLLTWAVPKGPSLDPKEKRLAVHVEDHPIDYGKFEGIIPKNQYGARVPCCYGTVARGRPRETREIVRAGPTQVRSSRTKTAWRVDSRARGQDKSAQEIEEEKPAVKIEQKKNPRAGNGKFRLTNPDKVLYQEQGLTKRDLALYYEGVADLILPHVRNRPLTLVRCPNGPKGRCFYQKNINETIPEAIESVPIPDQDGISHYMMANSPAALIGLVQMGVLEIHPWGSTADDLDRPDRMFFDLDPDLGLGFEKVIEAARVLHARLAELGLISFLKTTGGKGLHVVVPLERRHSWDQMKSVSKALAEDIMRQAPGSYTSKMPKAQRKGKIFIDYLRNSKGQTAVAAFSTRAKPGATISVPLDWKELATGLHPDQWNVRNLGERLQGLRRDPWQDFFDVRQRITKKMQREIVRID